MVRIEHYTEDRIADSDGNASLQTFHKVRNAVVRACKLHGPTGLMGFFPLGQGLDDFKDVLRAWGKTADPNPVYIVVDDQLNSERRQYVKCSDSQYFSQEWIRDLMAALVGFRGWGIGISNIPDGYILVFAEKLMVTGRCFEDVGDLASLVQNARESLSNEHQQSIQHLSGSCKELSFEDDRLVCTVDYDDGVENNMTFERDDVKSVWRHPFREGWMLSLKNGLMLELPDETTFTRLSDWFDRPT